MFPAATRLAEAFQSRREVNVTNKMILAPEYGGDGEAVGCCARFEAPSPRSPR